MNTQNVNVHAVLDKIKDRVAMQDLARQYREDRHGDYFTFMNHVLYKQGGVWWYHD